MPKLFILTLCATLFLAACSQTEVKDVPSEIIDTLEVQEDIDSSESQEPEVQEDSTQDNSEISNEAVYTSYTDKSLAEYAGRDKVIFFHASWCSTCKALDNELESNISQLPANTVVLKADYDSQTDLRQKYGVNLQHTLVFIDDSGEPTRPNLLQADLGKLKSELQ